ncbi:MAG: hypothetical protein IKS49_00860 [Actinomycetaceae bacterium]|nr:hypothetical protein [Actinomycetaceae bacterium]
MSKKMVAIVAVLVLVLAGVGGWFLHSSMVKKDYEKAWTGYENEVKAWTDVNERYQVLEPVCGELAGASECGELKTAGEEATKAAEKFSLDLAKAQSASKEETQKLEKATSEIKAEREKLEPAVEKVEKAAETTIQDKFGSVVEEAEKKAGEADGLAGSLKGKVKDENTLGALTKAAGELSTACGKWKGKDIPSGQEGVQAYLELKRLTLTCNDAVTKANESYTQWQKEEDERKAKEMVKDVNISDGATLSGTVVREGCGDENYNYGFYTLRLDNPVTFHPDSASGPLNDGSTSVTLSTIQIAEMTYDDSGWCGSSEPWESRVGQHVKVSGKLFIDVGTAHYHGPVVFGDARLVQ